eukprot:2981846-Prymnesium_polylepis.1
MRRELERDPRKLYLSVPCVRTARWQQPAEGSEANARGPDPRVPTDAIAALACEDPLAFRGCAQDQQMVSSAAPTTAHRDRAIVRVNEEQI